ncbi:hypothetical protein EDD37DRAFT_371605 [Exophiala viscosa]|uniref:uncharacterized protein n=1 Tax=Exophiala viscosa TaxID=2486360 RepID=UPI0021A224B8|nr:hypothetical protein EDD37DRAFT_371605 [Exophiala viscosa]
MLRSMAYLNTTGLAVGMMLLGIENTGMHITSDGRLVDYRLRPGIQANPQSANGKKTAFTDKEVELLRLWMATSSDDTHLKISPFETLENVLPTHTFLAWKSKWKEGGVQKLAPVTLRTDAPYKNLKSSEELVASAEAPLVTTISPDTLTTPSTNESICIATKATTTLTPSEISTSSSSSDGTNPCVATEPRQPTVDGGHGESKRQSASQPGLRQDEAPSYYELRADRLSNILRELDIEDEAAFERWLAQPFVRSAYNEVFTSMIVPEIANTEAIRALDQRPCYNETASTLNSRVAKAMDALGNGSSKFLSQNPDKSGWMKDDHSVRFIVSMVSGGRAPGSCWNRFDNPKDQEHLCQKALLLLRWLQWVYRPAGGSSLDSIRRQVLKDDWRAKLAKLPLCNSKVTANPPSPPSPGGLPPVPMEQPTITPTANDSTLETSTITLLQEISDSFRTTNFRADAHGAFSVAR